MQPETEAHLLRLTLAQKDCPEHIRGGFCRKCKATNGKVPLFPDTVRVNCSGISVRNDRGLVVFPLRSHHIGCICQGRGWMPSPDPIVWAKALFTIGNGADWTLHALEDMTEWGFWQFLFLSGDFEAALPHAVKAMKLAGVLEVPDAH